VAKVVAKKADYIKTEHRMMIITASLSVTGAPPASFLLL
jgi:hypothetical protein